MFALQVTAIFNITDRGYVLAGTLQDPTASIGIEYKERKSEFGILVNITKQEAENLIGKILFEE